ncbi:Exostosin [Ranunculus cassubicifolius]
MEKFNGGSGCNNPLWCVILGLFTFIFFSFCFRFPVLMLDVNVVQSISSSSPFKENRVVETIEEVIPDPCSGRYVYVQNLPSRFNTDFLKHCKTLNLWTDMCPHFSNEGYGPKIEGSKGWFATNQFALDVIFHNRMKHYKCLTQNSSLASAVYVPFYAGLDIGRYLWGDYNISTRDSASYDLMKFLVSTPEWNVMRGKDHFLVGGRVTWDFRRQTDSDSDWGNKLMLTPEAMNMTALLIESCPWFRNEFAIPYPTYFHPSSDDEVLQWQEKMRRQKKKYLFSFAGAPRPKMAGSIRGQIMEQCRNSGRCKLSECFKGKNFCQPSNVMKLFQDSVFCLQPPGDSYTRRSAFDSILAGCIPVFFHQDSAYTQYVWHLPQDYKRYSVFIPEEDIRSGNVSIDQTLSRISEKEVNAMKEEVISLIPKLVYADPGSRLETFEDAFDISIKGIIQRVDQMRRGQKREQKQGI